ncbi:hypothetical protein M514_07120 [Trichuris suis]|uniref:C2H2-type domain-containing protein n=1 Tax=Trichuris suis TaxID=68888 RepID=A0A085NPK2_9BILA|nr:hypothetical protein M514_07120 [Trichuris suis]
MTMPEAAIVKREQDNEFTADSPETKSPLGCSEACNGHVKCDSSLAVACSECYVGLDNANLLRGHFRPGSYLKKDLCCRICLGVFASDCARRAHARIHENRAPFVCPECGEQFTNGQKRDQHMLIHQGERWVTVAWMCPVCYKHYNNMDMLLSHLIDVHTELLYSCEPCSRVLHSVSAFERHCQQKHGKESVRHPTLYYACGILSCSWKTRSRDQLKEHFCEHLSRPADLPRCCCCGRIFQTESDLLKHQAAFHSQCAAAEDGYAAAMWADPVSTDLVNAWSAASGEFISSTGSSYKCVVGKKARFGSKALSSTVKLPLCSAINAETHDKPVDASLKCRCCGVMAPENKILLEHGQDHIKAGSSVCLLCKNMPLHDDTTLRQHLKLHVQREFEEGVQPVVLSTADYYCMLRVLHLQA